VASKYKREATVREKSSSGEKEAENPRVQGKPKDERGERKP
jgi:hypothetical protein